jgi:hypothetical protein
MTSFRWPLAAVAVLVVSCSSPIPPPTTHAVQRQQLCSGQADVPCLSGKTCVADEARSCQVCYCSAIYAPMPCWATYGSRWPC